MHKKLEIEKKIFKEVRNLNKKLENNQLMDAMELLGNPKKLLVRNFASGLIKGIGIGIGISIITAILIYTAQRIITLNIPVISKYIADILEIVNTRK